MVEPRRVLLVDDHDDARELLGVLVEMHGHEVVTAGNGASAIEIALAFRPHVAFIDIRLPDMEGFDVARALRTRLQNECPRLIALSGLATTPESRDRALREGFDEYVVKPIDAKRLEVLITTS